MKKFIPLIICIVTLAGCATALKHIQPNQLPKDKYSLVFGRLDIYVESNVGLDLRFKNEDTEKVYSLMILNHKTPMGPHKNDDPYGYFVINAPAGHYKLFRIIQSGVLVGPVDMNYSFNVPADSQVYIGTMVYEEKDSKNYLNVFGKSNIYTSIMNEKEEAVAYLRQKGYELKEEIIESIMKEK